MQPSEQLRCGIDAGGTHTDAVLMSARGRLLAKAKVKTTGSLRADIAAAVGQVMANAVVPPQEVNRVMLATTHVHDAVTRLHDLRRVATVRIGAPLTLAVPPLATWPGRLRRAVSVGEVVVRGGAEYDGRASAALDEDGLARFLATVAGEADGVAITSVFSPVAPAHELAAAAVVKRELGAAARVSLSHEIGTIGLLERENATVLNAALAGAAEGLGEALQAALDAERVDAELFLAQNDGTLMVLDHALGFPVLMIASGPATSIRGAAHLSGVGDGVVLDVGGASTAACAVVNGVPRASARPAEIAGVRMGFLRPDVRRLPFGGGSVIGSGTDPPALGPETVGPALDTSALVFGGQVATLTDAAVAARRADLGRRSLVPHHRREPLARALAAADAMLTEAVHRAGVLLPHRPLVVVGGAGMLVPDALAGVNAVIRPPDGEVAGAVGAAMAAVGGDAEVICPNRPEKRRDAMGQARVAACARAVGAGADPDGVAVVQVEEVPLTYLVDPAIRIRVKAAGPVG